MTKNEALALHSTLEQLRERGPGADEEALREVRILANRIRNAPGSNAYVREKAGEVVRDFEVWLSARKWQKIGDERARGHLFQSLFKLRSAIQSFWPEPAD